MPSDYAGNPTGVQAPDVAPGPNAGTLVRLPADGDAQGAASIYQPNKDEADRLAYLLQQTGGGLFGDGSDGNLTFDGAATVLGMVPSANVYTLIRDIFAGNLTITGASVSIATNGFRIYAKGTLTTNGGKITANGNFGAGVTPGAATNATGVTGPGAVGGAGGASGAGFGANPPFTYGFGVGGGAGGTGAAGAGGASNAPAAIPAGWGSPRAYSPSMLGFIAGYMASITLASTYAFTQPVFGSTGGGGGGAGGAAQNGGGGGGGGGVLAIAARNIVLNNASDFQALGGGGGNAVGTNAGGGGGGGGGVALIAYSSLSGATPTAAASCTGGVGGAKTGTGVVGANGSNGTLFLMQVA